MQCRVDEIFQQGLEEPSRKVQDVNARVFSAHVGIRTLKDSENERYPTSADAARDLKNSRLPQKSVPDSSSVVGREC